MKALLLVLLPVLIFSKKVEIDTTGLDKQTKESVIKILSNIKKTSRIKQDILAEKDRKIMVEKMILAEKKKQQEILEEIKTYVNSVKKEVHKEKKPETFEEFMATKTEEYNIDIPAQEIKWEQLPKRGLDRLFSKNKWLLLPYIVDLYGNQIYLEKK